jgi:selenocysteine-specific translation elongation factor
MEPDRWAEERRRGMTIDLGFAWLTLPSGQRLAFVDVPGHERFVPNMLAGVGPVPGVLFVVAADEGWMPQSAEHLAVLDALGIRHGVLAVTRCDLPGPGPALAQAAAEIAATSLGTVEAVAVSAVTGEGLPRLLAAMAAGANAAHRLGQDGDPAARARRRDRQAHPARTAAAARGRPRAAARPRSRPVRQSSVRRGRHHP